MASVSGNNAKMLRTSRQMNKLNKMDKKWKAFKEDIIKHNEETLKEIKELESDRNIPGGLREIMVLSKILGLKTDKDETVSDSLRETFGEINKYRVIKRNKNCKICDEPLKSFDQKNNICRVCWLEEKMIELKSKSHTHDNDYKIVERYV